MGSFKDLESSSEPNPKSVSRRASPPVFTFPGDLAEGLEEASVFRR